MGFAQFMSSGLGRGLRIVAGIILIAVGLAVVGGTGGIVLAVVGLVPLLAQAHGRPSRRRRYVAGNVPQRVQGHPAF
jgi:hypothetical protein